MLTINFVISWVRKLHSFFDKRTALSSQVTQSSPLTSPVTSPVIEPESEFFSLDQLHALSRQVAELPSCQEKSSYFGRPPLYRRLAKSEKSLSSTYFRLAKLAEDTIPLPNGAEWILDNYHIIENHLREFKHHLPLRFYRTLPCVKTRASSRALRVEMVAEQFLLHRDFKVEGEALSTFVKGFQETSILTSGELWALPALLRLTLIDEIARLGRSMIAQHETRQSGEEIARAVLENPSAQATDVLLDLATRIVEWPQWKSAGVLSMIRALRAQGVRTSLALHWLEERFKEQGLDVSALMREDQRMRAEQAIRIGNCITSLRFIAAFDWTEWFEGHSKVEEILREDPAHSYHYCDLKTKDTYRHEIESLARHNGKAEVEIAAALVKFAAGHGKSLPPDIDPIVAEKQKHIGYFLISRGRELFESSERLKISMRARAQRIAGAAAAYLYFGALVFLAASLTIAAERLLFDEANLPIETTLLFLIPFIIIATEVSTAIVQWISTKAAPPRALPKLDFDVQIPLTHRCVVAVQAIFNDTRAITAAIESIEVRFLGNDDPAIHFALLADLPDSCLEASPSDEPLIQHARGLINALNARHCLGEPPRFHLFFRTRLFNPRERVFMGWERKRGKIEEFNEFLLGSQDTSLECHAGDGEALRGIPYVLTLDNDSQLPRGCAARLLGTLAHPLNQPILNRTSNTVSEGYSVLQPRVGMSLASAQLSPYSRLFCGNAGLDPYTSLVSNVYQDIFGEGSYIGKGLYAVRAFHRAVGGRFPENSLLSHDLIEGIYARTALVSDVELIDEFPSRYTVNARREHRWVRGDWQLLPWLLPWVRNGSGKFIRNSLSALGWWKILDNLRRSLVAPATFFLLFLSFSLLANHIALGILLSCLALLIPLVLHTANSAAAVAARVTGDGSANTTEQFFSKVGQVLLTFVVLPHQTFLMLHAIGLTLIRLCITRTHLLQWESAYHSEQRVGTGLRDYIRELRGGLFLTLLFAGGVLLFSPHPPSLVPLLLPWLSAPLVVWLMGRPFKQVPYIRSVKDSEYVRRIAWETWLYFEDSIVPANNFLVPDNLQMVPRPVLAERTSPTNIGLSTLAIITALDLGFITLRSALERLSGIFHSLEKLERWKGHFLNWYDIKTLQPLRPRYVSSVDSGNFVGSLITLSSALKGLRHAPLLNNGHWSHLAHALSTIAAKLEEDAPRHAAKARAFSDRLRYRVPATIGEYAEVFSYLHTLVESAQLQKKETSIVTSEQTRLINFLCEFESWKPLIQWHFELEAAGIKDTELTREISGTRATLPAIEHAVRKLSHHLRTAPGEARAERLGAALEEALHGLELFNRLFDETIRHAETISDSVQLGELYDRKRRVFFIGFNVDTEHFDQGHYDLLASEARITSFLSIARGEVPQKHWFILSRALTKTSSGSALVSWTGTMFEYLMPLLVTHEYPGTILSETFRTVVALQQRYGKLMSVPWGISESAYAGVDYHKTYQYRAFGVPGLGLKRGLSDDLVISPYSTFLALSIAPRECLKNIVALTRAGCYGEYGFYEAIDYSPQRLSAGERSHVVRSFFAHHQAMTLVSINNFMHENIMRDRFHGDVRIKAAELLLQEKFPENVPSVMPHRAEQLSIGSESELPESREIALTTPHTQHPITYLLSNGRYSVLMDNAGGGYSSYGNLMMTRWRDDQILNAHGTFIFIRDVESQLVWSSGYQPTRAEAENYEVSLSPAKVEYRRRDSGILTTTEITVSREDNIEIRRITFSNISSRPRTLEVTSYGEVALNSRAADAAHPAFSKMFIESEYLEDSTTLLFQRRSRGEGEVFPLLFHSASLPIVWAPIRFETSRQNFIGRGRSIHSPLALTPHATFSPKHHASLDPIFSLRTQIQLEPGASHSVTFLTGVASSREELAGIVTKYQESGGITRAFELSESHCNVELRTEQYTISQSHAFQRLCNALTYHIPTLRADPALREKSSGTQSGLWRFGVSGDVPIVTATLTDPSHLELARELLTAHEYLRLRGVEFDLILLNEFPGGYMQDFQQELDFLVRSIPHAAWIERRGGIFLRTRGQLSNDEVILLLSISRVVLHGAQGSLGNQLKFSLEADIFAPKGRSLQLSVRKDSSSEPAPVHGEFENGYGAFMNGGAAYQVRVGREYLPPLPWSNIVANSKFGFLVTESGGGYTWSENSRENRLTEWGNDPTQDPPSEVIYLKDLDSGTVWSATPRPIPATRHSVVHSFGSTIFESSQEGIESSLTLFVPPEKRCKRWMLRLNNSSKAPRRVGIVLHVEWVLGINREQSNRTLRSDFEPASEVLYVRNSYNNEFAGRIVAIGSDESIHSYTTNRAEFIGRHRDLSCPRALIERKNLSFSKTVGTGLESCGSLAVLVMLKPGESKELTFFLSEHDSFEDLRREVRNLKSKNEAKSDLTLSRNYWEALCSKINVTTPDRAFDLLLNGWLLYQTVSCRLFGRTGFYQSSGAFGFRDQLQDVLALLEINPGLARKQIILHASRQFIEGDVQHWWHPPTGRGVRTRISDDLLWLPYVVCKYIEVTGDDSILGEQAHFIESPLLQPGQADSYVVPSTSSQRDSILEHCLRAIEKGLSLGEHGLPLMGAGDWNDGMNEVGIHGKGESVWLAFFLIEILQDFSALLVRNGAQEKATKYLELRQRLVHAATNSAWDGKWFLRAFYDDGTPLGSAASAECRIDSISQSWSVISNGASREQQDTAMQSVFEQLVDTQLRIIKLLSPPFDHSAQNPGYIKGYLPGIRENGGQYSHAAAWVIMAAARLGLGTRAFELFNLMNPIMLSRKTEDVRRYRTEPYALCGDVYSHKDFAGQGGWSWYTGSAGWMFQVGLREILGIKIRNQYLSVMPCIPRDWDKYEVTLRLPEATLKIIVYNPDRIEQGECKLRLNDEKETHPHLNLAELRGENTAHAIMVPRR